MAEPLEKWRVFLHPTSNKIASKNYSGPARVLGGAGTGKTVIAMHCAKHLASQLEEQEKILFTTFTANLAGDIKENLRKICIIEEQRHIEVVNLDAWVAQFMREQGFTYKIVYDNQIEEIWEIAMVLSGDTLGFSSQFYSEEWLKVISAQEAYAKEAYMKVSRSKQAQRQFKRRTKKK